MKSRLYLKIMKFQEYFLQRNDENWTIFGIFAHTKTVNAFSFDENFLFMLKGQWNFHLEFYFLCSLFFFLSLCSTFMSCFKCKTLLSMTDSTIKVIKQWKMNCGCLNWKCFWIRRRTREKKMKIIRINSMEFHWNDGILWKSLAKFRQTNEFIAIHFIHTETMRWTGSENMPYFKFNKITNVIKSDILWRSKFYDRLNKTR